MLLGQPLPSANLFRAAARYGVELGDSNHPMMHLLNSLTMNIDPNKVGAEAFNFGTSSLPTAKSLENMGKTKSILDSIKASKSNVRIITMDTETSGLGLYSQVRSLAASSLEINPGGSYGMMSLFDAHFNTAEMASVQIATGSGVGEGLGGFIAKQESKVARESFGILSTESNLLTEQGRRQASQVYHDIFKQVGEHDLMMFHNAQFDIGKILTTVYGIDEFFEDAERVKALKNFESMVAEGKVINSLDLARDYLSQKGLAAVAGEASEVNKATKLISTMFAPETLAKVRTAGSASPFGLENISLSTNLLSLIGEHGGSEGQRFLEGLKAGNHIALSDSILTNYMTKFILEDKLDYSNNIDHLPAHIQELVKGAKSQISKAAAITPTTNIATAQHMSDAVFSTLTETKKGLRSVQLSENGNILSWSQSHRSYISTNARGKETLVPEAIAEKNILQQLNLSKAGRTNTLLTTGINYLEQSAATKILNNYNIGKRVINPTRTEKLIEHMTNYGTSPNVTIDQNFVEALTAAKEHLKFNNYDSRPAIFGRKGITAHASQTFGLVETADAMAYINKLTKAGFANAHEDMMLKRSFIEMSTITSGIPFANETARSETSLAAGIIRERHLVKTGTAMDAAELIPRVSSFVDMAPQASEYLSGLGVAFFDPQVSSHILSSEGTITKPIISSEILRNIDVTSGGKKVKFLSDEFLKNNNLNKFGVSVAQREEGNLVNLVFGNLAAQQGNVVGERLATELSEGVTSAFHTMLHAPGSDVTKLVEEGHFANEQQAILLKERLRTAEGRQAFSQELQESIRSRGAVVAGVNDREVSEGLEAIIERAGGGIGNEAVGYQAGLQFSVQEYGAGHVGVTQRLSDQVVDVISHNNPELGAKIASGEVGREVYATYKGAIGRAAEDSGFFKMIRKAFSSKRLDTGIFGSGFLREVGRDAHISEMYKALKPKIGLAALAVGAAAGGYYMHKRHEKAEMYDETMQQQSYESSGRTGPSVSSYSLNSGSSNKTSNPLATAGIVRGLDRNKVGHTAMGPNKYNHLYGG